MLQLAKTSDEWKYIANEFEKRWNFPHCIGALDGKHVNIKKPPHTGSFYFNYKNKFSIVLMALVNANYEFLMVDVGINGRISDGGVIRYTSFGQKLYEQSLQIPEPEKINKSDKVLPYVMVADDAFAMSENLLKPYSHTGCNFTKDQRIFNYRLSRARRIVENVFGILSSRFGVFQRDILLHPEKVESIVLACCYLHNFLRSKSPNTYTSQGSFDIENHETGDIYNGSWRNSAKQLCLKNSNNKNTTDKIKSIRDAYSEYFNNEGAVPWQNKFV